LPEEAVNKNNLLQSNYQSKHCNSTF